MDGSLARCELLTRYLPRCLVNKIARSPTLPDKSGESEEFLAACLLADISGFTPLTRKLSEADPAAGADHLTAALNDYFEKLIAIIDEFGGDVVKFAGDALLILFHRHYEISEDGVGPVNVEDGSPGDDYSDTDSCVTESDSELLASMACKACLCALRFQAQLSEYRPLLPAYIQGDFSLSMHVGVGVGRIFSFHIGGLNDRWEIVFAGDPISQVASAEPDAKNGQVVVSPQTWALTFKHLEGTLVSGSKEKNVLLLGVRESNTEAGSAHAQLDSNMLSHTDLPTDEDCTRVDLCFNPNSAQISGTCPIMSSERHQLMNPGLRVQHERAESVLKAYIPGAVCCRFSDPANEGNVTVSTATGSLRTTGAAWGNEIRRVAVVFCNMPGLELSSIFLIDRLQLILRSIQALTYRYEGSVNKFLVDDKGATVILCFGLPPVSHEDDSARAVGAALAIHTDFQHQGIMTSIGIASGQAFCGTVGAVSRCEYTIMGDVVNLAARLMQNARYHGILVDAATYAGAASRYLFDESIKPIRVKGRSDPITVFAPETEHESKSWLRKRVSRSKPLFGREEEKTRILSVLQLVQRQRADLLPTLLIEGDAGSGKTRLIEYIREQAEKNQLSIITAEPDAFEDKTAYYSFRSVFSTIFDVGSMTVANMSTPRNPRVGPDMDFRQHVKRKCQELVPELVKSISLLASVLPVAFPPAEHAHTLNAQAHANATRELLTRILISELTLRRKQGQRTVLIIDDAQFMDSVSWALTAALRNASPDLLIVIAARSENLHKRPEFLELTAADVNVSIKMTALSVEESGQLIASTLGHMDPTDVPDELVRLIMAKSHGNARLIESWSSYLHEKGLVSLENGKCTVQPEAKHVTIKNDAYAALITSRLDRLGTAVLTSLKTGACIGHKFTVDMVASVHPSKEQESQIKQHFETAKHEDIIVEAAEGHFQFRNPEIIQILQDSLTSAQKRSIHLAITDWYTSRHDLPEEALLPLLARHFSEAQELDQALLYLERAAAQAMMSYNHEEAIQFYTQLVQIHQTLSQGPRLLPRLKITQWRHQIAEAHYRNGNPNASIEVLIHAFESLGYVFPKEALNLHSSLLSFLYSLHLNNFRVPWHQSDILSKDEQMAACRCMCDVTFDLMMQGRGESAYVSALKAYSIAKNVDSAGLHGILALTCAYLSAVNLGLGHHNQAARCASRAKSLVVKTSDLHMTSFVKVLTAMHVAATGHCSQVTDDLLIAVSDFGHHRGNGRLLLAASAQLISMFLLQGNVSQAAEMARKAEKMGTVYGDTICVAYALGRQAEISLWQGSLQDAFEQMGRLQRLQESHLGLSSLRFQIFIRGFQAVVFLRRRECIKAYRASKRIFEDLKQFGTPLWIHVSTFSLFSNLLLGLLEQPKAALYGTLATEVDEDRVAIIKEMAEHAVKMLAKLSDKYKIAQPQFKLAQGIYLFLAGDQKSSRKALQSGLQTAQYMQLEREEALILRELGARFSMASCLVESHQSLMRQGIRV